MIKAHLLATVSSFTLSNTSLASNSRLKESENDSNVRVWKLICERPCKVCGSRLTREIKGYGIYQGLFEKYHAFYTNILTHISFSPVSSYRNIMWCAVRWTVPFETEPDFANTTCSTWIELGSTRRYLEMNTHLGDSNGVHGFKSICRQEEDGFIRMVHPKLKPAKESSSRRAVDVYLI